MMKVTYRSISIKVCFTKIIYLAFGGKIFVKDSIEMLCQQTFSPTGHFKILSDNLTY